ncbi:large subunit ribosomal protein L2 [Methanococcus voltae]|jgi:large subunit ribosomal protein L2|uniref:Large ribosomal subunit protein uL2 n=2 Tax=Methanococcus voltae TaxID=2188 RepID=A0A8J7USS0_METVO|nr:50S ribosomal protein L2 [Methanococcus voltae]MBP2143075.1 large subunit ribosomal protein L2 [Methanococcus voltae]MBP2172185.1 large subunit ribosomal protein L2 [Methanococcus voltae]MBP2200858.1 large subunit ribosomal protein L2 [Methanococcus voltae]MCS3921582.1 large subunit ribosomal protein L2 [Methanococcus voltae PS]
MGKRLISQNRGRGTPKYTSPSHKRKGAVKYRSYDESEKTGSVVGALIDVLHDPGRSAPVGKVRFENGEERLVLIPEGKKVGDEIACGISAEIKPGNVLPLAEIPEGIPVYNIETIPGDGGKLVRAGGCYAHVVSHDVGKTIIKLPSGYPKVLNPSCRATIGVVAGGGRKEKPLLKAGKKFHALSAKAVAWPRVRGVAMNAVDHPYGGGRHQHTGKPTSVSRHTSPGRKVGHIASRRTGGKR